MNEWDTQECELGRFIKIKHGYAFKSEYFSEKGRYIILTPGNFFEAGGFRERLGKDRFYTGEIPKNYILDKDDLIVAMTEQGEGLLGSAALIPSSDKYLHNQRLGLINFKTKSDLDKKYLYYLFNTSLVRQQIRGSSSGTKVRHTSPERIYRVQVEIPTLPIQKKIAGILSAYDDLIENNNRRIALLEKMAEEIYREWFVRMRFPRHEGVGFHKGVPEGWEVLRLGDIANLTMGQSPKSEFYNYSGDGLPFNQGVGTYGDRFPRKEIYCSVKGRIANEGDILFSVRAPVGRLNIADCEMIIGRGIAAISHKQRHNSYLFYLLKSYFSSEDIIGNGSIFNSVGKDELASLKILSPSASLVSKYNEFAKIIDSKIGNLHKSLDILKQTRDRLLTRLISGKLSVADLDIEQTPSIAEDTLKLN